MKLLNYLRYLPLISLPASAFAADRAVTSDITSNTKWTANNTYILRKSIFVKNGATLTIEPGTTILGGNAAGPNGIIDNGGDDTYGSLVIARGAKINAVGTPAKPIVFTAIQERDGLNGNPSVKPDPALGDGGFWGGIVILGRAPINFYVAGTNANENSIEGFPAGSTDDIKYGGNNRADNSGALKYVSIRFGGYVFNAATGSEINALTMGGVGSGTVVENVEVISNTDDGVEIFGGTVNTKRIAVAFCQDDSFDLDEGHQGFHQFWFSIQNETSTIGDRGGEWDGGNGSTKSGTPNNRIRVYNATMLGNGQSAPSSANPGFYLDDFFAGELHNSLIHDFSGAAITKDAADGIGGGGGQPPAPIFSNNTWGDFAGGAGLLATLNTAGSPSGTGNSPIGVNPRIGGISRNPNSGLDPLPLANSPLLVANGATLSSFPTDAPANFFETVSHRGAFGQNNWLDGWSYLSKNGYLLPTEGVVFTKNPASAVVAPKGSITLRALAVGKPSPSYQWFRNGVAVPGATSDKLVLSNFTAKTAGKYFVIATSAAIEVKSAIATVALPKITSNLKPASLKLKKKYGETIKANFKANNFSAKGLPPGLKIDESGKISGKATKKGKYTATIVATQKKKTKVIFKATAKKIYVVK
ncbi:MAG: immunoglobulin domain-containing protein [Akkermansiaceae bacterium]